MSHAGEQPSRSGILPRGEGDSLLPIARPHHLASTVLAHLAALVRAVRAQRGRTHDERTFSQPTAAWVPEMIKSAAVATLMFIPPSVPGCGSSSPASLNCHPCQPPRSCLEWTARRGAINLCISMGAFPRKITHHCRLAVRSQGVNRITFIISVDRFSMSPKFAVHANQGGHRQFHHGHVPKIRTDFLDHPQFPSPSSPCRHFPPANARPLRTSPHREKTEDLPGSIAGHHTAPRLLFILKSSPWA